MSFLDAAYHILREAGQPVHYTEITRRALAQQLITPKGQTPEATMGSRLYTDTKNPTSRFKRFNKGCFALAERSRSDGIAGRVQEINRGIRQQLHTFIQEMPAGRFEALVGELLLALGFEEESIQVTSYHGDGGIDVRGILNAGGITRINAAVQVKRWRRNIQAPLVQAVRGSLTTHEHGIMITSSNFSKGARLEANAVGKTPISLVSGQDLLDLLIQHGIGVNKEQHTVISLDEEWWGEMSGSTAVMVTAVADVAKIPAPVVTFPLTVAATHAPELTAVLLNRQGQMIYAGQEYRSPSGAGKVATGWKSANGWTLWRFQHPETGEWRTIQELREQVEEEKE
jgi:restriction system protein